MFTQGKEDPDEDIRTHKRGGRHLQDQAQRRL